MVSTQYIGPIVGAVCVAGAAIAGIYISVPWEESDPVAIKPPPAPQVLYPPLPPLSHPSIYSQRPSPPTNYYLLPPRDPVPDYDKPIPMYIRESAALWKDYKISHHHFLGNLTAAFDDGKIYLTSDAGLVESDAVILVEIVALAFDRERAVTVDEYMAILNRLAPDDSDVQALRSILAFMHADIDAAAVHAEAAITADPDGLYPNFAMFLVLFDSNYEDALPYGERVLELDPDVQVSLTR